MCLPDFTEMETQPLQDLQDFQDLCTFESFKNFWHYYGYGVDQQELIDREFKRIKGKIIIIKSNSPSPFSNMSITACGAFTNSYG